MLGILENQSIELKEILRFPNNPLRIGDSLHWDIPRLISGMREGLHRVGRLGLNFESISTDSWGVDYLLFDRAGKIIEPTFHYRDPRTKKGIERAFSRIAWEEIFAETGIQFMPLNTIYQLAA